MRLRMWVWLCAVVVAVPLVVAVVRSVADADLLAIADSVVVAEAVVDVVAVAAVVVPRRADRVYGILGVVAWAGGRSIGGWSFDGRGVVAWAGVVRPISGAGRHLLVRFLIGGSTYLWGGRGPHWGLARAPSISFANSRSRSVAFHRSSRLRVGITLKTVCVLDRVDPRDLEPDTLKHLKVSK